MSEPGSSRRVPGSVPAAQRAGDGRRGRGPSARAPRPDLVEREIPLPNGRRRIEQLDLLGRLRRREDPDGSWTRYDYDLTGKPTGVRHSSGQWVKYETGGESDLASAVSERTRTTVHASRDGTPEALIQSVGGFEWRLAYRVVEHARLQLIAAPFDADLGKYVRVESLREQRRTTLRFATGAWSVEELTAGKLLRLARVRFGDAIGSEHNVDFAYDERGKLRSAGGREALYDDGGRLIRYGKDWECEYDSAGGRVRVSATGEPTQFSCRDWAVIEARTGAARITFEYDELGRRIRRHGPDGETRYAYDMFGHLSRVDLPCGLRIEYLYDGFGRLVGRRAGDCIRYYLVGIEGHRLAEFDETGRCLRHYLWLGPQCVGRVESGTLTQTYHRVHGGRLAAVGDAQGRLRTMRLENPFGDVIEDGVPGLGSLFGDPLTGLVHAGTRWLDPHSGQFLTPDTWYGTDPAELVPRRLRSALRSMPGGIDRNITGRTAYAWCAGDPVNYTDPNGHNWLGIVWSVISAFLWGAQTNSLALQMELFNILADPIRFFVGLLGPGLKWYWRHSVFNLTGPVGSYRMMTGALLLNGFWREIISQDTLWVFGNIIWARPGDWEALADERMRDLVMTAAAPRFLAATAPAAADVLRVRNPKVTLGGTVSARATGAAADQIENAVWTPADATPIADAFEPGDPVVIRHAGSSQDEIREVRSVTGTTLALESPLLPAEYVGQSVDVTRLDSSLVWLESNGEVHCQPITFIRGNAIHLAHQVPDGLPARDLIVKELMPARVANRLVGVDLPVDRIVLRLKNEDTNAGFSADQFLRVQGGDRYSACRVVRLRGSRELVIDPALDSGSGPSVGLEVVRLEPSGAAVTGQSASDIGADPRIRVGLGDLITQARARSKTLRKLDGLEIENGAGVKERRIVAGIALQIEVDPLPAPLQGVPLKVDVTAFDTSVRVTGTIEGPGARTVTTATGDADRLRVGQPVQVLTTSEPPVEALANIESTAGGNRVNLDIDLPQPAFAVGTKVALRPLTVLRTLDAEAVAAPANRLVLSTTDESGITAGSIVRVRKEASAEQARVTKVTAAPQALARLNVSLPASHASALSIAHFVPNDTTRRVQVTAPDVRHKVSARGPVPYASGSLVHITDWAGVQACAEVESVSGSDFFLKEPVDGMVTDTVDVSSVELTGTESRDGRLEGGTVLVPADPSVELSRMDALQQHELRHVWQAAVWGPFFLSMPIPWLVHFGFSFSKLANSESSIVRHIGLGGLDSLFALIVWGIGGAKDSVRLSGQLGPDSKGVTFTGNPDAALVSQFSAGRRVTVIHGDKDALNYVDSLDAAAGHLTLRFALNADIVQIAAPGDTVDLTMSPFENIRQTVNTWFSLNLEQLWAEHIPVAWGRVLSNFLNRDSWFPFLGVYPLAWIIAGGDRDRVPSEQEAAYLTGELYTSIVVGRPGRIRVGQFARLFAFVQARQGGISGNEKTVSALTLELPPPPPGTPMTDEQMAARVHGAVLVPGTREVRFRERRFIPMQERAENVFGAFFSTTQPGTYKLKAPGMLQKSIVFKFGFHVDFVELGEVTVEPLTVSPSPADDLYETERIDFDVRGDESARYELQFPPGSTGNLGTIAGRRYTIGTLTGGTGTRRQKVQIIARYRSDNPVFRGAGQLDQTFLAPEDLVNLCEEHELTVHELTAPKIDPVHAGTVQEFTVPIAPRAARVTSPVPAGAIVNARIVIGSGRPARLQFVAPNNVAASTPIAFDLDFGADPAFRKTLHVTVVVEPAPAPTPTDPPFLPHVDSNDYLRYIQPPARGLVRPLINGRSSNGAGPDIDLTEPLDEMEKIVKSLGAGDSVYLSAWFFEPATRLTAGGSLGATHWGELFALKAHEGVKVRILINDFDPISGMDRWLQSDDLDPLNAIILAMPEPERDNFKYVVSLHPAHVGTFKSLLAGQGGRDIYVASHHQKFMVVRRGTEMFAFAGGLDIESRKTPANWSYLGLIAWHDLHVMLEGPITRDLEKEFVLRWNREKGSSRRRPLAGWKDYETLAQTPLSPADDVPGKKTHLLQMVRTVSTNSAWSPYSTERDDVSQMYRRAIETATRYLYLENQYFRSTRLADWIVRQARAHPDLIVIMVVVASAAADDGTNAVTEHGDYLQFQTFDTILSALGARGRLYTMTNRAVHSKFMLIDDTWMTIGSANANVRSFELDSEINLSIADAPLATSFRHRLWSHNLGVPEATVAGWQASEFISRWDAVAATNAARAAAPESMDGEGVVAFDYRRVPGKKHQSIPDALARLDLETPSHVFAGPLPEGGGPIRLA